MIPPSTARPLWEAWGLDLLTAVAAASALAPASNKTNKTSKRSRQGTTKTSGKSIGLYRGSANPLPPPGGGRGAENREVGPWASH